MINLFKKIYSKLNLSYIYSSDKEEQNFFNKELKKALSYLNFFKIDENVLNEQNKKLESIEKKRKTHSFFDFFSINRDYDNSLMNRYKDSAYWKYKYNKTSENFHKWLEEIKENNSKCTEEELKNNYHLQPLFKFDENEFPLVMGYDLEYAVNSLITYLNTYKDYKLNVDCFISVDDYYIDIIRNLRKLLKELNIKDNIEENIYPMNVESFMLGDILFKELAQRNIFGERY
jgi:hypothetical protein